MKYSLIALAAAETVLAFPFVSDLPGVDSSLFRRQQTNPNGPGGINTCPFNANHVPAVGIVPPYWYNNATNGKPGNGKGGYQVPAPGDTAHYFQKPKSTDVRGPCPGLNAAANHGFLSRDGIVTFNELVDAQQNLYNVGYDLAVTLAVLGLTTTDGDIVTEKLSIGCDATTRTSFNPTLTGSEPGLDGHNKFEADTSLTRNDYFTAGGDNFKFNGTLYKMMQTTTGSNYDRNGLALYRSQRYSQSLAQNPNFYFGPFSLLLFGASSFLYELMPSSANGLKPDEATISSFFSAVKQSDGTYAFGDGEKIPDNWYNRVDSYDLQKVGTEIIAQYAEYPVLFGGATGNGGFDAINFNGIKNGSLVGVSASGVTCLLYQLATERVPSSLNSILTPTVDALSFALSKLNPQFANLGCALQLTK